MAKKSYEVKVNIPDFYNDPLYQQSQGVLFPFGTNMLSGNLPDYYKPIGETGGTEFNNMLALMNRDTTTAVNENMTRRNISRGGLGANIIAKAVADNSTKLRWEDYSRALTGKQNLLNLGLNTVSNVGSNALNYMGQKNNFNMSAAGLQFDASKFNSQIQQQQEAQKNAMWSQILSSVIGGASNLYGMGQLTKALGSANQIGSTASTGLNSSLGLSGIKGIDYSELMNLFN
jgi:hypothetical protein